MTKPQIRLGDIFRFPASASIWGYGQVLLSSDLQYVVVFSPESKDIIKNTISNCNPLFHGWTADAKFITGDWEVVENAPPIHFTFPNYKVNVEERFWVTDVQGRLLREATRSESMSLLYRSSHSPIAFEKAFQAYLGMRPWESRFNDLLLANGPRFG